MNNKIPYTSYSGNSEHLCKKGDAVEFIQPWYTPISTTPENTGMAVGGIGNTFTLTPNGNTPNFSFIPGIFVDCSEQVVNFNDFYASVMNVPTIDTLQVLNEQELGVHLNFYPALFDGKKIDNTDMSNAINHIRSALKNGGFYQENKANFTKWNIEFSNKTLLLIDSDSSSIICQLYVALDFFNGLLINDTVKLLSLTAGDNNNMDSLNGSDIDSVNGKDIEYQALYPLAEYKYNSFDDIKIKRKVVSPIVKNDKRLCSLPMHWNHFELTNHSAQTRVITLAQPLQNLIGSTYRKGRDGIQDSACTLSQNPIAQQHKAVKVNDESHSFTGVQLTSQSPYQSDIEGEVVFGVQAENRLTKSGKVSVSVKPTLYTSKVTQQTEFALKTGRTNTEFQTGIYTGREALSALVVVQVELEPGESVDLRFAQVMAHSKVMLNGWHSDKAYTQFYPQAKPALPMLQDVLPKLEVIEQKIIEQQTAFLEQAQSKISQPESALRYATMAMNSLSFLAESTVWDKEDKFLVKECVDYPFFNSLDVYFYGSFSLLYLLPELDGCVMKEFSKAILAEDFTQRRYWEYEATPNAELIDEKYQGVRAIRGAVIHDLGSPFDIQPDAYSWHNVKEWKDLAPKYILMVYRHYQNTQDISVVKECWQAVTESIDFLSNLVAEGDDLPLTRGTDDTFDNLASHGISIYCASLWVAGLQAASELAQLMGENDLGSDYLTRSKKALATVEQSLWDEKEGYYHFFVTPVQAKHLTGEGYQNLETLGLTLTGDTIADKNTLNAYLNETDTSINISKVSQRVSKKRLLSETAPQAFTQEYLELVPDSDNSFGDALLADSYLKLIGLEGIFPQERIQRALDYVYKHNFEINSPKLGVANMTLADGSPHEAFQAQDVWIGVQFSVATALSLAGKSQQAETLMDTVYTALYDYSKIPFAAPEGFNCSVSFDEEDLSESFKLSQSDTKKWLTALKLQKCVLSDGRVSLSLTKDSDKFVSMLQGEISAEQAIVLHKWLLSTGLKYTAGRYFRPGMIFAYMY
ncbi:GH116 family glycosyl hydrolase [Vibrio sp. 10N.222.51.C8]|uniref:GH116 family glycosyl hydrolase n=3 Tax=Vibrio TaxID=662 RepID=UPI000C817833|nr:MULTISPECIES: GH116 family glycosyl hydrolase [unclassified Vibrio]PMN99562.1 glucosylceramidase [Vibrio sp. 10N.222.55.C12]PMO09387.1 glucosylceramidase [Vibrio sp. 10N.222.54.F10]PMO26770.1 glucosylceramidase [Vibrio sp. 10N.222.54.B6]TKF39325.1 glucosylceramidase [Vibrio sp. F13]TKF52483.1 glucosylceramidase [Vibrio sp. F13]